MSQADVIRVLADARVPLTTREIIRATGSMQPRVIRKNLAVLYRQGIVVRIDAGRSYLWALA